MDQSFELKTKDSKALAGFNLVNWVISLQIIHIFIFHDVKDR